MAITDWWLGHATETTAIVVIRSDSVTTYDLVCGGTTFQGAADPDVADGIVAITVTGLSADQEYPFTVGSVSGTLKTNPVAGSTFRIGYFSCMEVASKMVGGIQMVRQHDPAMVVCLGDMPYCEREGTHNGITYSTASDDPTEATMNLKYLATMRNAGVVEMAHARPFIRGADDHEYPGDNWDHDYSVPYGDPYATVNFTKTIAATQAAADAIFVEFKNALLNYQAGNPPVSGIEQAHPTSTLADSDYPSQYAHWVIGDAEFFLLDCVTHRSSTAATDDSSKTLLGTAQKAQFKTDLVASTATFKVLLMSKRLWDPSTSLSNHDSWGEYGTERGEILTWVDANVTGVICLSGDQHRVIIGNSVKAASATPDVPTTGDLYDSLDVCACPIGVHESPTLDVTVNDRQHFTGFGYAYGILEVHGSEYVEAQVWNDANTLIWRGRVYAGSNCLTVPALEVSI